jgi:hypothetical protein
MLTKNHPTYIVATAVAAALTGFAPAVIAQSAAASSTGPTTVDTSPTASPNAETAHTPGTPRTPIAVPPITGPAKLPPEDQGLPGN